MRSELDNFINLIFKYFHNLNEYQITNKNIVYMLMSMFYLQQICHALNGHLKLIDKPVLQPQTDSLELNQPVKLKTFFIFKIL